MAAALFPFLLLVLVAVVAWFRRYRTVELVTRFRPAAAR
ncbi:hypothetical protein EV378_6890 [Pseudonocardia endophytica]|uniref:Uncharacterized protein n=1 Tax=Pseudonocardia endophytica TaxID=401976 RepID=A0A4R1HSP3_PSEEN|nr:hypothetical protein EV378_6890 [Pseudonocardia endophytica]